MVFSFARDDDPALPVARRVADRHPGVPSVFVVDSAEPGGNSKVNRLAAGVRRARHRYFLFSDGNVRVRPDFLNKAIAPFRSSSVGLLSHLFRGTGARSLASRVECLYLNGALQAATAALSRLLRQPCVVGKSILISREAFFEIGGFGQVRDHLAEDYLLGVAVKKAGYRVLLSSAALDTTEIAKRPAAVWSRHRRWAIMRRRLAGPAYAAELLANPLPWFAAALAVSGSEPAILAATAGLLLARYAAEWIAEWDAGHPLRLSDLPLLPARDLAVAALFWAGLFGRATRWRGRRVVVGARTRIETPSRARASGLHLWAVPER